MRFCRTEGTALAFPASVNTTEGLSTREYFAVKAMQGLLQGCDVPLQTGLRAKIARESVEMADALIAALNEEPKEAIIVDDDGDTD